MTHGIYFNSHTIVGDMETTYTKYGWKTKSIVRKQYHVKHIGKLMMVDTWVRVVQKYKLQRPIDIGCGICKREWIDIPLLENVNIVIFKKVHKNMTVCDSCRCMILEFIKEYET